MIDICRTCLVKENNLVPLSNDLVYKIKVLSSIEVQCVENFTMKICSSCLNNTNDFYKFREKIIASDRLFKSKVLIKRELCVCDELLDHQFKSEGDLNEMGDENQDGLPTKIIECKTENIHLPTTENINIPDKGIIESYDCEQHKENAEKKSLNNAINGSNCDSYFNVEAEIPIKRKLNQAKTSRRSDLKKHLLTHLPDNIENDSYFGCKKCDFKTKLKKDFHEHVKKHYDKTSCTICGILMLSKNFNRHMKTHKKQETMIIDGKTLYFCDKCDFKSDDSNDIKVHKKIHVEKTICSVCGDSIATYNLSVHLLKHNGKSVTCKVCGKTFKNVPSYRSHALMHIEEENTCKVCGKQFLVKGEYKRHLRNHREKTLFPCSLCNRSFTRKTTFDAHLRSHTGERPYPCEHCGKLFSSTWSLKTHIRQHTKENPYKCDLCPLAFRQRVSLKTHMKSKHKVELPPAS